jgi:hypothetical protein
MRFSQLFSAILTKISRKKIEIFLTANIMITIFGDFSQFSAKMDIFLITNVFITFSAYSAVHNLNQTRSTFFGENIFKHLKIL